MRADRPARAGLFTMLASLGVGTSAAALLLYATGTYGVNFTPDTVHYLATAENLLAGKGFTDLGGVPYTVWPPLYPSLLAAAQGLGLDALVFARWLNVVLIAVLPMLTAWLCFLASGSAVLSVLVGAVVGFSPVVLMNFGHAWSDPLFMVLMVLAALLLVLYGRSQRLWLLGLAAFAAALGCLQRYVGVTFIATGGLAILLLERGTFTRKLVAAAGFGALSALPVGTWMVRNLLVAGALSGARAAPTATFAENARLLGRSVLGVASGGLLAPRVAFVVFALAAVAACAGMFAGRTRFPSLGRERAWALCIAFALAPIYAAMLLFAAAGSGTEISERILSPLLPFLLVALVGGVVLLAPQGRSRLETAVRAIAGLVLVGVVVAFGWNTLANARRWHDDGVPTGFNQRVWFEDEVYRWLLANSEGVLVYSNVPAPALELMSDGRIDARIGIAREDGTVALPDATGAPAIYAHFDRYHGPVRPAALLAFRPSVEPTPFVSLPGGGVYRVASGVK